MKIKNLTYKPTNHRQKDCSKPKFRQQESEEQLSKQTLFQCLVINHQGERPKRSEAYNGIQTYLSKKSFQLEKK